MMSGYSLRSDILTSVSHVAHCRTWFVILSPLAAAAPALSLTAASSAVETMGGQPARLPFHTPSSAPAPLSQTISFVSCSV